jgi:hypothetical protein
MSSPDNGRQIIVQTIMTNLKTNLNDVLTPKFIDAKTNNIIEQIKNTKDLGAHMLQGVYRYSIIIKSFITPGIVSIICAGLLFDMKKSDEYSGNRELFWAALLSVFSVIFSIIVIIATQFIGEESFNKEKRILINILMIVFFILQVVPLILVFRVEEK